MASRISINLMQLCQKTMRHLYRKARACHDLLNTPRRQEPSTSAFHCTLPATTWSLCCSAACRRGMEAFVAVEKASTATLWWGTRARNLSMVSGSTAGAGGSSSSRSATNCCSKSALSGPECLQHTTGSEVRASVACCVMCQQHWTRGWTIDNCQSCTAAGFAAMGAVLDEEMPWHNAIAGRETPGTAVVGAQ